MKKDWDSNFKLYELIHGTLYLKAPKKEVDVIGALKRTSDRDKYLLFTKPFINIPNVIVTSKKFPKSISIKDLRNKKVTMVEGYAVLEIIRRKYPWLDIEPCKNDLDGLMKVSFNESDATIIDLPVASYLIEKKGIGNLRVAGYTDIVIDLGFASRKDLPILNTIMDKGLALISQKERDSIYNKWIHLKIKPFYKTREFWMISSGLFGTACFIISLILLWNRTLKKTVKIRTAELAQTNQELIHEISERRQAEEELHHLRNYLSNIIDSMPSVLVGVNDSCKVTLWNKTAELTTGIPAEAVKGELLSEVFPQMASEMEEIIESVRTGKIKHDQKKPRSSENRTRYEDITIYPLIANGVEGAVIRIDDVTKEYELEQQLNHSRKMDAIGQLAGGVAHDFNNMLGGIMSAAQLLKLPKMKLDENGIKYVDMILQASSRAADLTAKLLAFGRKGKIASTALNIHNTIEDAIAILNRTIDKKVRISHKKNAKNSMVVGDSSGLQNALMNLGINASHAMPNGGEIYLETSNILLNKTYCDASPFKIEPGEYIEITIRDTGCGIPLENIRKIFEPFYTTKGPGEGTGLGLAAVYGTIKDHHGAINVYSEVGTGTAFHIYLPCSEGSIEEEQIKTEVLSGTGKILLVDDEEIIRITGKQMLEEMGYTVLLAENGREAVDLFLKLYSEIDLVIMDMIMPEMNGREAFSKLKEIDKNCKVAFSSGFPKYDSLTELRESGLVGFIQKPYRDYELSGLLAEALEVSK